jgi:membrane protein insertase Oxa1/YidC/SpoIIIJ
MMAVFAFMYTSAFSLYIILSSGISMLKTLGINAIVDAKFKKEQAKKQDEKIRGRVHTPTEEPKKEDNKKKNSKKKEETPENDFLSGKADKKHIRGRVK